MEIFDLKDMEAFKQEGRSVTSIVNEPFILINQVCLESGQDVPLHQANSNVTILVIQGEGTFHQGNEAVSLKQGQMLRIPFQSYMRIVNNSFGQLVFLVVKAPHPDAMSGTSVKKDEKRKFVTMVDFPLLKPGKEEAFKEWFNNSSRVFSGYAGFISRTLLQSTKGAGHYAAIIEHDSKETFMAMNLSDDHKVLHHQTEQLIEEQPKPHFYETLISYRK